MKVWGSKSSSKNPFCSFPQATGLIPALAAVMGRNQFSWTGYFQNLSAPAPPVKDCIRLRTRMFGPLYFLYEGIKRRVQWIPLHPSVLTKGWKRWCKLVYLMQLLVCFCSQVTSWTLSLPPQQSKLPPLVSVLSLGIRYLALCECRAPFYSTWGAQIFLFFPFLPHWHCKVPAQLITRCQEITICRYKSS